MAFRFIGDPNDKGSGPEILTWKGYEFVKNGPAVTVKEPENAAKLKGHSHFEEVDGRSANKGRAKRQGAEEVPEAG